MLWGLIDDYVIHSSNSIDMTTMTIMSDVGEWEAHNVDQTYKTMNFPPTQQFRGKFNIMRRLWKVLASFVIFLCGSSPFLSTVVFFVPSTTNVYAIRLYGIYAIFREFVTADTISCNRFHTSFCLWYSLQLALYLSATHLLFLLSTFFKVVRVEKYNIRFCGHLFSFVL